MNHNQETLTNNLKTLFIDSPGATAATAQIWFRAGSALEKKDNQGIAHFLEHMFFKGTPKRPGAAIAHEVETFGGEINAFTSFDYTCYYINTPNSYLNNTVEILMDMVSNPQFKQEDLEPERGVVFEEYRRSVDNPGQFAFHKLQKSCFTGGYAHPILGREDTIKNFSREQLKHFREEYYNLSNSLLVIAGDLKNKEQIKKTIEDFKLPTGPSSSFPNFELKTKSSIDIHEKDTRMCTLNITIQSPKYDDNEAAAEDLAMNCLGHGETSRFYKRLVLEDSISNSSGTTTMFMNKGGLHYIRISFPVENSKKILKRINEIFSEVIVEGIESSEVDKIKNQYVASKVYEMESLESFAFSLGHGFAQTGDITCEEEFIKQIRKTSPVSVNKAYLDILARPIHLSLQVPKGENIPKLTKELEGFVKSHERLSVKIKKSKSSKIKTATTKNDPQVKLVELKGGINLLYRQNLMNPTFVMHSYIKGGLTEETKKTNGVHHFISALMTKGHNKVKYEKIKMSLEDKSASLSGFSGKNAYGLTMHGQSEHFNDLSQHFFGALFKPDFPAAKLKHEKLMVKRNLESQLEDPIKLCFKVVNELNFKGHPYTYNMLGTPQSIKGISKKQIEDTHKKGINKKPILISYCGDLTIEEVIAAIEPHIEKLPARPNKKTTIKKYKPIVGQNKYQEMDREQTQIFYGLPIGPMSSKENTSFKMLTTHLSGQSSELFVEVRDKQGLCYSAQPIHFSALEGGYWGVYMASGFDKVDAAVEAIKKIITNIKDNGLSEKEFSRIKKMIEGQTLMNVQTNDDYASIYSVPALHGYGLDYYHNKNKAIKELKYEDFQKTMKRVLNKKWNTVIVGRKVD